MTAEVGEVILVLGVNVLQGSKDDEEDDDDVDNDDELDDPPELLPQLDAEEDDDDHNDDKVSQHSSIHPSAVGQQSLAISFAAHCGLAEQEALKLDEYSPSVSEPGDALNEAVSQMDVNRPPTARLSKTKCSL